MFDWENLSDTGAYAAWRNWKLDRARAALTADPVPIDSLAAPGVQARAALAARCDAVNFALYRVTRPATDPDSLRTELRRFAGCFGLEIAERHRSAGSEGIVALKPDPDARQRGYIPYSSRAMNWHTDGYYNAPGDRISGFVLHCVRPAAAGGENQILDPEIVYIRLRDRDPELVRALMHPEILSIPENREPDGRLRPVSTGPVFYPDPGSGRLQMRYTARTRSVAWRDDPASRAAEQALRGLLEQGDPLVQTLRLAAGEGILNNNVLHNRTGFDPAPGADGSRLIYRVRFRNRVQGEAQWQSSAI